jgi:hypothetical protein
MDGWNGRCLAVVPLVLGFQQGSCGNGSEYQWGTTVEEDFELRKWQLGSPSLDILLKIGLKMF